MIYDDIFYCPRGVDTTKHERTAKMAVELGHAVAFHRHRHGDECERGCWFVSPTIGPPQPD